VAGSLVERHPELGGKLDRWSHDESFWVRRSALLALLGPLRRGAGDWRRFKRYADAMLDEKEFFIRKAIGWVLRETSKKRPERVRDYVAARLDRLSGVTFREAVKRLPDKDRKALQAARKAAREAARRTR
jgi:3-methyladenine DNA glycosylase AlkD